MAVYLTLGILFVAVVVWFLAEVVLSIRAVGRNL